jgi:hypothetical protein
LKPESNWRNKAMTMTNKPTQSTEQKRNQKTSSFALYDAVEVKGWGDSWHSDYWVLAIEPDNSCIVSRTYQGDHNITQLSFPSRVTSDRLRKCDTKLKVTGSVYSADSFLKEYGDSMLRAFRKEG